MSIFRFLTIMHKAVFINKLINNWILFSKNLMTIFSLFSFLDRSSIGFLFWLFFLLLCNVIIYCRKKFIRKIIIIWWYVIRMIFRKWFLLIFHKNVFHFKFKDLFISFFRKIFRLMLIIKKDVLFMKIIKISYFRMFLIRVLHFMFRKKKSTL
jgi:hypothetical protein